MLDEKTTDLIERTSILQETLVAVMVTLACDDGDNVVQASALEDAVGVFLDVDSYVRALCQRVDRLRAEEGLEQC